MCSLYSIQVINLEEKMIWTNLRENEAQHLYEIIWMNLCENPAAINRLKEKLDRINLPMLSTNLDLLE